MMYVIGRLQYPEMGPVWMIRDVYNEVHSAMGTMRKWLMTICLNGLFKWALLLLFLYANM